MRWNDEAQKGEFIICLSDIIAGDMHRFDHGMDRGMVCELKKEWMIPFPT